MTDIVKQFVLDFKAKSWKTDNLYERFYELCKNSNDIFDFTKEYLHSFEKSSTIFDNSLNYIDKTQFEELINIALGMLKDKPKEIAENIIAYASLQFPELLHNHLELIFNLNPNGSAYYANYPWRNLGYKKVDALKTILLSSETDVENREKAFECLLETRNLETIKFAFEFANRNQIFEAYNYELTLLSRLEGVGFTKQGNDIKNYCPNSIRHFSFAKDYLPNHSTNHPTWNLPTNELDFRFGGILEKDDKNPFFHLLTFNQIPKGLNITDLDTLVLGFHLIELNNSGTVFYQHDNNGKPTKINLDGELKLENEYDDQPIIETQVRFSDTPARWERQDWALANGRENLFRLGGEPTWIQSAEVLTCPICKEKMDFLLQLDSDLPEIEDGVIMFGSGGICYAFWCDKSKVSGYTFQCT